MNKVEFKYDKTNPSETGLFYYLGTSGLSTAYNNPADTQNVIVSSSPLKEACKCTASTFIGLKHAVTYCITQPKSNAQFTVDLKDKFFMPTGYALRNYTNGDRWWLNGWNLEATNDNGKTWIIIDKQRNNNCLKGKGTIWYFPVEQHKKYYNQLRIVMQQPGNCAWELPLSGFELYGYCLYIDIKSINDNDEKQQYQTNKNEILLQKIEEMSSKMDTIQQKVNDMTLKMNEEIKNNDDDKFDKIMKEIKNINQNINKVYVHNMNVNPEQQKVKLWLENKVKLSEYYELFVQNGIVDLSTVAMLTMETIKTIGIDKVGHQMKILNQVIKLKQTVHEGGPTAYK